MDLIHYREKNGHPFAAFEKSRPSMARTKRSHSPQRTPSHFSNRRNRRRARRPGTRSSAPGSPPHRRPRSAASSNLGPRRRRATPPETSAGRTHSAAPAAVPRRTPPSCTPPPATCIAARPRRCLPFEENRAKAGIREERKAPRRAKSGAPRARI